jgi:hypothetical protein
MQFVGVIHENGVFSKGCKKIVPVDEHKEWLAKYYDNPETGFKGHNRLASSIEII